MANELYFDENSSTVCRKYFHAVYNDLSKIKCVDDGSTAGVDYSAFFGVIYDIAYFSGVTWTDPPPETWLRLLNGGSFNPRIPGATKRGQKINVVVDHTSPALLTPNVSPVQYLTSSNVIRRDPLVSPVIDLTGEINLFVVPEIPVLTPLASPSTLNPLIEWNAVAFATQYEIQVALDPLFASIFYQNIGAATSVQPGLLSDTVFYVRVRSGTNVGFGDWWSGIITFTTRKNISFITTFAERDTDNAQYAWPKLLALEAEHSWPNGTLPPWIYALQVEIVDAPTITPDASWPWSDIEGYKTDHTMVFDNPSGLALSIQRTNAIPDYAGNPVVDEYERIPVSLAVSSASFGNGDEVPTVCCSSSDTPPGGDESPQLAIGGIPAGALSLVIDFWDETNPATHWLVTDIDPTTMSLVQNCDSLPLGTPGGLPLGCIRHDNDFGGTGYEGPRPLGAAHRHLLTVYALDVSTLGLTPIATRAQVLAAMAGHVITRGTIAGGRVGATTPYTETYIDTMIDMSTVQSKSRPWTLALKRSTVWPLGSHGDYSWDYACENSDSMTREATVIWHVEENPPPTIAPDPPEFKTVLNDSVNPQDWEQLVRISDANATPLRVRRIGALPAFMHESTAIPSDGSYLVVPSGILDLTLSATVRYANVGIYSWRYAFTDDVNVEVIKDVSFEVAPPTMEVFHPAQGEELNSNRPLLVEWLDHDGAHSQWKVSYKIGSDPIVLAATVSGTPETRIEYALRLPRWTKGTVAIYVDPV